LTRRLCKPSDTYFELACFFGAAFRVRDDFPLADLTAAVFGLADAEDSLLAVGLAGEVDGADAFDEAEGLFRVVPELARPLTRSIRNR
jgi:hypothetical protein